MEAIPKKVLDLEIGVLAGSIFFLPSLAIAFFVSQIAKDKGRSAFMWFCFGLVMPHLAPFYVMAVEDLDRKPFFSRYR